MMNQHELIQQEIEKVQEEDRLQQEQKKTMVDNIHREMELQGAQGGHMPIESINPEMMQNMENGAETSLQ